MRKVAGARLRAIDSTSDPEVEEARRVEREYREICNERESSPLASLPMPAVIAYALGSSHEGDLIDSMLEEAEGALFVMQTAVRVDPHVRHDDALGKQFWRLQRTIEAARELYRRRLLVLDGSGLAVDAVAEE